MFPNSRMSAVTFEYLMISVSFDIKDIINHYRNEFYFCGFYQCVNSGETLTK